MNIFDILLSFTNSIIEITFFTILIFTLLRKKPKINLQKFPLVISLILANIFIDIPVKNQGFFTIFSMFIVYLVTFILAEEEIIHSIYLFAISYCITLITQLFLIIPFSFLLTNSNEPINMLFGNSLTLIAIFFVCKFLPIHYIYDFVLAKDFYFRLILSNTLISIILIVCLYRIKLSNVIIIFPIIIIYLSLVILFNIIFINSKLKMNKQQIELNSYNEYLPVVDELINQVRTRQHQYKNDLASLNALTFTCKDYTTLCAELSKNIDLLSIDSTPSFLLSFNLKLMSGFLYNEYIKAQNNGINLSFDIKNYDIQTSFPEYLLIEAIGILIDNSIEASSQNETIYLFIDSIDSKFIFSISNPGPTITPNFLKDIFKQGYSTKNNNRGLGLYALKKMIDKYNGTINVSNLNYNNISYINFTIKI